MTMTNFEPKKPTSGDGTCLVRVGAEFNPLHSIVNTLNYFLVILVVLFDYTPG